jgi:hypothetical protein
MIPRAPGLLRWSERGIHNTILLNFLTLLAKQVTATGVFQGFDIYL